MLISQAVARLEAGMFGGGAKRPEPINAAKRIYPRASIGFGLQREKAGSVILSAILKGDLLVYVIARSTAENASRPIIVPVDVLKAMPKVRGGLPDHVARPPLSFMRDRTIEPDLFAALSASALHLRRSEFAAWYRKTKNKRLWQSQREGKQPRIGRPSKITIELLRSIRARRAENSWCAGDGIAALVRLMESHGAPDRYLLRRAVQQLYEETGDCAYRVVPRKRAKQKSEASRS